MTMEITPEELAKLPKKIQAKIKALQSEHSIELSKRVKYEALFYGEVSDIYFSTDFETDVFIPSGAQVTFRVPDPRIKHDGTVIHHKSAIRIRVASDGSLNLMGDSAIVIRQTASNCVDIKVRDWHKL